MAWTRGVSVASATLVIVLESSMPARDRRWNRGNKRSVFMLLTVIEDHRPADRNRYDC